MVCGLFIPNFDNTVRIVTERRIRSLHDISRSINGSLTQEKMIQDALDGMKQSNPRDMHFAMFYIADNAERGSWPGGKAGTGNDGVVESDRNSVHGSRRSFAGTRSSVRSESVASSGNQDRGVNFRLVGSYGIDLRPDDDGIPLEFPSIPDSEVTPINAITKLVLQVKSQDSALFIPDLDKIPSLSSLSNGNPFDDPPRAAIVLPIRSSVEDRLHGVMLLGLNTRAPWDEEYSNYIQLVKGLLATGLATIKLHEEDLARARYMAALNRQKNEELQSLLTHRTEELKTSELKFRSAFAACPAGIWIGSPEGTIWDMNQSYHVLSGLPLDACLDDWIYR
jgi:PAS domain-containing protein